MTYVQGPFHERTDTPVPTQVVTPVQVPLEAPSVVVANPVLEEPVFAAPVQARQVRTASASEYAPDAVVAAVVGLVLLLVGLIAVVRAGISGPMSDPVVSVLGFTHTATLGFIEVAIGLALLASGASRSRSGAVFFGLVLGVAGFVGAVQTSSFRKSLALESSMAWLCVVAAVVVTAAALVMPRFIRRSMVIERR